MVLGCCWVFFGGGRQSYFLLYIVCLVRTCVKGNQSNILSFCAGRKYKRESGLPAFQGEFPSKDPFVAVVAVLSNWKVETPCSVIFSLLQKETGILGLTHQASISC